MVHPHRENGDTPRLGVVIVTYNAADFVAECLESLLATNYPNLRIVVVDNASPDNTFDSITNWARGETPFIAPDDWPFPGKVAAPKPIALTELTYPPLDETVDTTISIVQTGANLGFAGGVNVGLRALLKDPAIDRFWVLNPDAISKPETPFALVQKSLEMRRYAAIGGRIVFRESPDKIQIDAGRIRSLTGTPVAINLGASAAATEMPAEKDISFISGGSIMVSREFIDRAGLLDEAYFLYFEEIDWQLRRGDLPLGLTAKAVVLHKAGASIGSAGESLKPQPFSMYFGSRSLTRFVWRWWPYKLPLAYLHAFLRFPKHADGSIGQITAMMRGIHQLPPPDQVRRRLPESVWAKIL